MNFDIGISLYHWRTIGLNIKRSIDCNLWSLMVQMGIFEKKMESQRLLNFT